MPDINIAENKFAEASNSMLPYSPAKAVDGVIKPLNRWMGFSPSVKPEPMWLKVRLGADYWIGRWVVSHMGAVGWPAPDNNMCDYRFRVGLDERDVDEVKDNKSSKSDRTLATAVKADTVKVYVTKGLRCNPKFAAIVDLEVFEVPNAPWLTGLSLQTPGGVTVPLSPTFSSRTYCYTANVGSNVVAVKVTPTSAADSITVNDRSTGSGAPVYVDLTGGNNTITIRLKSKDNNGNPMEEAYSVVVIKAETSAYLSGLVVSPIRGSLNPPFVSTTMNYTANVVPGTASVKVTPTAFDGRATIFVNKYQVPSGSPSPDLDLVAGKNTITIKVAAVDGSSYQTYTVDVSRPSLDGNFDDERSPGSGDPE